MVLSNTELKKKIEEDEKLSKAFHDSNVHIESFLESKNKNEFGKDLVDKFNAFVKDAEKKQAEAAKQKADDEEE